MEPIAIPRTIRERVLLNERLDDDAALQRQFLSQCRSTGLDGIVLFINTLLWTIDPREPERGPEPLLLYPVQIDKILAPLERALAAKQDCWWQKSRAVGFTWVFLGWGLHGWLFRPHWQGLLGSYKEDLVDDRTLWSHFGKLDFLLERLPAWFKRRALPGWNPRLCRQKLKLVNPNTADAALRGNIVQGDSANPDFGRGGRFLWVWFDEAASWPYLEASLAASSQTARSRFGGSTPKGMNYWGKWLHNPLIQPGVITLHWSEIPGHDPAWYQAECARLIDPVLIAQELDISYTGSVEGKVYPRWEQCQFGSYPYEPTWTTYVSWDAGLDTVAMIWWQRDPVSGQVRMLDCYHNRQQAISYYVPFVTGSLPVDGSVVLGDYTPQERAKITLHAIWAAHPLHFGDPSLEQRDVGSGQSPADVLAANGIHVLTNPQARDFATRKQATDLGLVGLQVNCPNDGGPVGCEPVNEAMLQARYPRRNQDAQHTSDRRLPIHDASSHFRTAVEYFFVNLPPHRRAGRPRAYVATDAYAKII